MTKTLQVALVALAIGSLLGAFTGASGGDMSIDISGKWRINKDLSDDPREVMKKKMEELRREHSGPPVGGMGGGPPGGGMGGRHRRGGNPGGSNREEMEQRLRDAEQARREILILQKGDDVTLIYANGDTVAIVPDGQKHTRQTRVGDVTTEALWKDFTLEVKSTARGREMKRLYRISSEGRLEVVSFINLPRANDSVEVVAVYDEVKEE